MALDDMALVIADVHPAMDGEYEFPWPLNAREQHYVKKVSDGVTPDQILDALDHEDAGVWVAICSVALSRADKPHSLDVLWETTDGQIGLRKKGAVTEVALEIPPASAAPSGDSADSEKQTSESSGNGSENPETTPEHSGHPV